MAVIKRNFWNLLSVLASSLVFLFSLLHLTPPAWAQDMSPRMVPQFITPAVNTNSFNALNRKVDLLINVVNQERGFSGQEIQAINELDSCIRSPQQTCNLSPQSLDLLNQIQNTQTQLTINLGL